MDMVEVLTNTMVAIRLPHVNVSNQHCTHLQVTQYHMSIYVSFLRKPDRLGRECQFSID